MIEQDNSSLKLSNRRTQYFSIRIFGYPNVPADLHSFDLLEFSLASGLAEVPCRKEKVINDGTEMVVAYFPIMRGDNRKLFLCVKYVSGKIRKTVFVNVGRLVKESDPDALSDYTPIPVIIRDHNL